MNVGAPLPSADPIVSWFLLGFLLLATASAQIAFKHYHASTRRSSLYITLVLFASCPPITVLAVRQLGIAKVYVLMSLSYALVAFMGHKLFAENITRKQAQGLVLITLGCVLYAL